MGKKIVVIGGVACGPKAAARVKRLDPQAEVVILEQGEHISYGACGLPFYLEGLIPEIDELIKTPVGVPRTPAFFKAVKGVEVFTGVRAEKIDRKNKVVIAQKLATGERLEFPYDKLVIATGSSPVRPPIEGVDPSGVYTLKSLTDGQKIKADLEDSSITDVVIVGSGLIGLECAEAFGKLGKKVTIIEKLAWPLPALLDDDIAFPILGLMKAKGIRPFFGEGVARFEGQERVEKVITEKGTEVSAQMVLMAIGVRPNVKLAEEAGLEVGRFGIKVDRHLRTSDPDIYAGGDCIESRCLISGQAVYLPMGSLANKHGRVIGDNLAGYQSIFPGTVGTAICRFFELNIARTGLTEARAKDLGYRVMSTIVAGPDKPHYMKGSKPLLMKLVVDEGSGKVLGAQIVGQGDALSRINTVAAVIQAGGTVEDLADTELAYAPPFSPAIDLLTTAAWVTQNKLYRLAKGYKAKEVKAKLEAGEDFVLLDVRTPKEVEEVRLPYENVVYIPLGKLRELALEKLPKDKEIICFCKISLRGFEAVRILVALGFQKTAFLEGGLAAWPYEKISK